MVCTLPSEISFTWIKVLTNSGCLSASWRSSAKKRLVSATLFLALAAAEIPSSSASFCKYSRYCLGLPLTLFHTRFHLLTKLSAWPRRCLPIACSTLKNSRRSRISSLACRITASSGKRRAPSAMSAIWPANDAVSYTHLTLPTILRV